MQNVSALETETKFQEQEKQARYESEKKDMELRRQQIEILQKNN